MILSLLLQSLVGHKETTTVTSLTPVYWGLAGTALAAIIAAITSWRASNKASKTAKKVAKLSRLSAQEIKDREYKNDYYKKVIDKRMKSLEFISQIISRFIITNTIKGHFKSGIEGVVLPGTKTSGPCYVYFTDNVDTLDAADILLPFDEADSHNLLWCNEETGQALVNLIDTLRIVVRSVNEITPYNQLRLILYSLRHQEVKDKVDAISESMVNELKILYDIEGFLAKKSADPQLIKSKN